MSHEAEILRIRQADDAIDIGRSPTPTEMGGTSIVVQTKTKTSYPTAAGVYYACDILEIFGPEVEGGAATYWPKGETIYVLNLGASVPVVGSKEIADYVPYRWVFRD